MEAPRRRGEIHRALSGGAHNIWNERVMKPMNRAIPLAVAAVAAVSIAGAQSARTGKTLDIYVVDVEGGNATLFVAPSGESVLIDTNAGAPAVRDADRIAAAAKDAGITRIDTLITTHWHG